MRLLSLGRVLPCALLITCSVGAMWGQDRVWLLDKNADAAETVGKSDKDETAIRLHVDHIFNGGINRHGDIVGIHHLPSAPRQMRVDGRLCDVEIKQTSPGGRNDVVTAKVILRDPATGKVVREKFSTLFPSAWGRADIEQAIREAYGYARDHGGVDGDGGFHGQARGIKIDGYLTNRGDAIATAFPVFPAVPKKARSKVTQRD